MKWLRTRKPPCPWDFKTCYATIDDEKLPILKWLRAQDPPCPWSRQQCLSKAGYCLEREIIITWINSQRTHWNDIPDYVDAESGLEEESGDDEVLM